MEACRAFDGTRPLRVGPFNVRVSDDAGLLVDEARVGSAVEIETYPRIPGIRQLPRPWRTRSSFGELRCRQFGTGLEPAETRLFAPGDRVRHINWPASLRLGRLYVTSSIRNAAPTWCFCSTRWRRPVRLRIRPSMPRCGPSPRWRRRTSPARIAWASWNSAATLRWLKPAAGRRQWERLLRAAVPASQYLHYLARSLDYVPATALPRQALVIAVSPVIDERFTRAIVDLAGRGYDVVLLAVSVRSS